MQEILAVIRMNKINRTKEALVEAGFPAFTAIRAVGRGSRPVDFEFFKAIQENPGAGTEVLPTLSQGPRLIPKRIISMVVPEDRVQDVIQTIIKVNQTGNPGDGKIFLLPVDGVIRVRTGETGADAVDEMAG
jgi:nitrogen regulatory protein PII 2